MYVTAVQHGGWRPLFCYESPRATSPPPTTGLGRVFGRGRSSVGGARDRPRWWSVTVRRRISVCHTATPPPRGARRLAAASWRPSLPEPARRRKRRGGHCGHNAATVGSWSSGVGTSVSWGVVDNLASQSP